MSSDQIHSNQKSKFSTKTASIWKDTKHDGIIPIVNFVEGVVAEDPNKLKRDLPVKKNDIQRTTLTTFVNGKHKDSIIQHKKLPKKQN